jgi:hypothetical protein
VALDQHRATGGKSRGGVTTGNRESQREVRGAEHHHRAQRDIHAAQVGARQRRPLGQSGVDGDVEELALAQLRGEQLELAHGATTLAFEAGRGRPDSAMAVSISTSPMARISSATLSRKSARALGARLAKTG